MVFGPTIPTVGHRQLDPVTLFFLQYRQSMTQSASGHALLPSHTTATLFAFLRLWLRTPTEQLLYTQSTGLSSCHSVCSMGLTRYDFPCFYGGPDSEWRGTREDHFSSNRDWNGCPSGPHCPAVQHFCSVDMRKGSQPSAIRPVERGIVAIDSAHSSIAEKACVAINAEEPPLKNLTARKDC